ncbi:MAG: hypothetical protein P1U50_14055 [Parvibaculaceae bacterium]|nr:hypothetical protein [Parvibaculaceae bacterium]
MSAGRHQAVLGEGFATFLMHFHEFGLIPGSEYYAAKIFKKHS